MSGTWCTGGKPENLWLGRQQEILHSDFGLTDVARRAHARNLHARTGTVVSLAPEYLGGQAEPASDQYALGVVIGEWVTGERLFAESETGDAPVHPGALLRSGERREVSPLPPEVEWVVLQALAREQPSSWAWSRRVGCDPRHETRRGCFSGTGASCAGGVPHQGLSSDHPTRWAATTPPSHCKSLSSVMGSSRTRMPVA
jgi:hypothetical protein